MIRCTKPAGRDRRLLQPRRMSVCKLTSWLKPSESRVRFLILDISLGCGFNELNVMNGLMHDAFWKSHDFGPGDVKLLQVDQLTESFGEWQSKFPFLRIDEYLFSWGWGLYDTFRKSPQITAIVEVELLQVGQLAKPFGEQGVRIFVRHAWD